MVVPEFDDARISLERGLNDAALDAAPAAVDQPHLVQASRGRCLDIIVDDMRDVLRRKRMEVQFWLDRNPDRFSSHALACS